MKEIGFYGKINIVLTDEQFKLLFENILESFKLKEMKLSDSNYLGERLYHVLNSIGIKTYNDLASFLSDPKGFCRKKDFYIEDKIPNNYEYVLMTFKGIGRVTLIDFNATFREEIAKLT
jgi:hypothetical protein